MDIIEDAVRTLKAVLTYDRRRLDNGLKMRKTIAEALDRGERPGHYRVEFLEDSVMSLVAVLGLLAEEFNSKYPNDRCSNQDFVDILASTLATIKRDAQS